MFEFSNGSLPRIHNSQPQNNKHCNTTIMTNPPPWQTPPQEKTVWLNDGVIAWQPEAEAEQKQWTLERMLELMAASIAANTWLMADG
jgi:hypothetical protein